MSVLNLCLAPGQGFGDFPPLRLLPPNQRIMKILELDTISEIVKGTPFLSKEKDIGPEP